MADDRVPLIFPFITLRYEYFGGLLYNPYFGAEKELTRAQAFVAGMCTGRYTVNEIEKAVGNRFHIPYLKSHTFVNEAFKKMSEIGAVEFFDDRLIEDHATREAAQFPTDGPFLSAPKAAVWDVTYACNLNCDHCLTDSGAKAKGELNTDKALELVGHLEEAGLFSILISGGEPFLRPDIFTILEALSDANIRVDIATNGLSLSRKSIKALSEIPIFHVHVSIDGIGGLHDILRGRRGAFEAACRTIKRLREENIAVSMNTTFNAMNISELDRLVDLARDLGCMGILVNTFMPIGRGARNMEHLGLSREQRLYISRRLAEKSMQLKGKLYISEESCFPFLTKPPRGRPVHDGPAGCIAGQQMLSISADGTVYPCPFLRDFPLGNVLHKPIKEIWNESPVLRSLRGLRKKGIGEPCGSCRYSPRHCVCGCRAAAYVETGDILAADSTCFVPLLKLKGR